MEIKRTPLNELCLNQGCKMVSFAGWEMPIQFSGLVDEHQAVRKKSGLFDISHMGVLRIKGQNPKDLLQNLIPSDIHRIGPGEACYTVLLNKNGGIIDDLIIYDLGNDKEGNNELLAVINAGCAESDTAWLKDNLKEKNISISDAKKDGVLLALQGPDSKKHLIKFFGESIKKLPKFGHCTIKEREDTSPAFIARTGYTGEEGYEILLEANEGKDLWINLLKEGVTPCGLGARDTLRLEAAMYLYGNDINEETTPIEAGLGWLVHLEMPKKFIGREVLESQVDIGVSKRLVGLKLQGKAIARKGYKIFYQNKIIGNITSGSWSPSLQEAIALAYVPIELAKAGTELGVEIRDKIHPAIIVKKPFYRRVS